MELTVLGCSGSFGSVRHGPCSSYLIRHGDTAIWMDCGNGSFPELQAHLAIEDLTAVVISHGHPDHCVDVFGLHVLLRYGMEGLGVPVLAAEGVERGLAPLVPDWGDVFAWETIGDGDAATLGDVTLRFSRTDHPLPTCAVEASAGGRRLVYTADTGPDWSVDAFGGGAQLVLSEATYLHEHRPAPIHLSAREAGAAARAARAERLVLTHLWPFVDPAAAETEGSEAFGAPVTLAARGMVMSV